MIIIREYLNQESGYVTLLSAGASEEKSLLRDTTLTSISEMIPGIATLISIRGMILGIATLISISGMILGIAT